MTQHVFIVGSKGIPGSYGGYETFVDKLTEYHQDNPDLKYHVACKADEDGEFEYHNARCFKVKVPNIGPAQAIYYDVAALQRVVRYIKEHKIEHAIVYVLACRIGPFCAHFERQIHRLGGILYVNPDGHEWMRAKWSAPIRRYWKISEQMMVKHCDLLVCDSKNIERYIHEEYAAYDPKTTYIAYGAETRRNKLADDDPKLLEWLAEKGLSPRSYYLVVGRFVPENNYETMIREFMRSDSKRDFALITNVNDKFLGELEERTHFRSDPRIKFVGTVYDQELLMKVRELAYGYFHGHEVGGTNPSLLEALGSTDLNLLLDVGFNREVAEDAALYWTKELGDLAALIGQADAMGEEERAELGRAARQRVADAYSWQHISDKYRDLFQRRA
ncbi:beta 1-4 rhamnosyltransferase Cps2T [Olsenella sp. An188]|uniref:beta 1-4 rhamnosyltransferase Cps2T n=1 Tax=Olsenella sp. An188 TaxID=1965579 RepID=UPI000B3A27A8|nr:glycosyltransferase family 1 protein [Olsenella sp. An188]OUP39037.1 glycosyl transferase [Olsenella sp. An188]